MCFIEVTPALACVACRFVAVERGAVSYPSYTIQRTRPVFSSRQQVLDYEAALALAARVDTALEVSTTFCWQLHGLLTLGSEGERCTLGATTVPRMVPHDVTEGMSTATQHTGV